MISPVICNNTPRVAIIGGGASGLFAAAFLKHISGGEARFVVYEKGDMVGRKLLLTGHGRCNITNRKSVKDLKTGYHEAGNFIYPSLKAFSPVDAVDFIENVLRVPLKEEDNNRMFPVSDKAESIRAALVSFIGEQNIVTNYDCVEVGSDGAIVGSDGNIEYADKIILACGGKSFPKTGSDGSGYKIASKSGHLITPLIPALSAVDVREEDREFTSEISGVCVSGDASLYYENRKKANINGDILFTHKGVSGPAIMELSREIPRDVSSEGSWIEIDFTPSISEERLDKEFIDLKSNTKLTTKASEYMPQSVANAIGRRAGVTDLYAGKATKEARKGYTKQIKHLELHMDNAPGYENAYVTRGGVYLKEIDRKTMRSTLQENLYIIGELLDIDGVSGGYNLQACMSEAFVAASDILS